MKPPYPFVECDEHGRQRSLVVCMHVVNGAVPVHYVPASDTEPGELLCRAGVAHATSDLRIICEAHALMLRGRALS